MAGASRTELLQWINDLLQLNYTKVEQCGAGGAYLQVLDSIYGDIPMARVKMGAKAEHEYLVNYKIMQNVFKAKKIDKPVPVEKLMKCKMQDNLEFLQWLRKFWDANYAGGEYDAIGRRKGDAALPPSSHTSHAPSSRAPAASSNPLSTRAVASHNANGGRVGGRTPVGGPRATPAELQALHAQVAELGGQVEGLERERDFYFEKLREIEILVTSQAEALELDGHPEDATLGSIQKILYSTEDGFEVPEGEGEELLDEEETF
ncbi:microtubule binding protein [Mycena polygramma]|nr:microtubule binding protein [Mycena polygramma]